MLREGEKACTTCPPTDPSPSAEARVLPDTNALSFPCLHQAPSHLLTASLLPAATPLTPPAASCRPASAGCTPLCAGSALLPLVESAPQTWHSEADQVF